MLDWDRFPSHGTMQRVLSAATLLSGPTKGETELQARPGESDSVTSPSVSHRLF